MLENHENEGPLSAKSGRSGIDRALGVVSQCRVWTSDEVYGKDAE